MSRYLKINAILLAAIVVWLAVTFLTTAFNIGPRYYYESSDRGAAWAEYPSKGRNFDMIEMQFKSYAIQNETAKLRRTTKKPWWNPWEYYSLMTHRRWTVPYMVPSEHPNSSFTLLHKSETLSDRVN